MGEHIGPVLRFEHRSLRTNGDPGGGPQGRIDPSVGERTDLFGGHLRPALDHRVQKALALRPGDYRRMLSSLRRKIKIVESQMSANRWGDVKYEHVPSRASLLYSKAFKKHDDDRYTKFLSDVSEGKKKMNASVLYPHRNRPEDPRRRPEEKTGSFD
jgi:hypothetical protein